MSAGAAAAGGQGTKPGLLQPQLVPKAVRGGNPWVARSPGCNTGHGPTADFPHPGEGGAGGSTRSARGQFSTDSPRQPIRLGLGGSHRKSVEKRLRERRAGRGFYYCGWRSRLPWRPTTKMRAPAARAVAALVPPRRKRPWKAQKEELVLPSWQMGWMGGKLSQAGIGETTSLPTPASPGQVARRARTLLAGSGAARAGSPEAPGAASAAGPPLLGSGSAGVALPASGCSGLRCSVELPAPMASPRFSRARQPGYAFPSRRDAGKSRSREVPRAPSSRVLLRTRPGCEWRRRARGKLLKRKKKKKKPPLCRLLLLPLVFPLLHHMSTAPDTPCSSISPQAAGTRGAVKASSQGPGQQPTPTPRHHPTINRH